MSVFILGQAEAFISIYIHADQLPETNEEMTISLTSVEPALTQRLRVGFSDLQIVIAENDNPGGIFQFSEANQTTFIVEVQTKVFSSINE